MIAGFIRLLTVWITTQFFFRYQFPPRIRPNNISYTLRYLKSVFPVVEDTVLLDTLSGSDNNVVKATETLLTLGFRKKLSHGSSTPRITLSDHEEGGKRREEEERNKMAADALARLKTLEEKDASKSNVNQMLL